MRVRVDYRGRADQSFLATAFTLWLIVALIAATVRYVQG